MTIRMLAAALLALFAAPARAELRIDFACADGSKISLDFETS
jgi:hypothetical protein